MLSDEIQVTTTGLIVPRKEKHNGRGKGGNESSVSYGIRRITKKDSGPKLVPEQGLTS